MANLMRRLLTGYAVSFNRRHRRTGVLFQNRYKSIICDEEVYFRELVRYIHLNPVRAGIVSTMDELDTFPYSGHSALMGLRERPWQDTRYVLQMFSSDARRAQEAYSAYVESAFGQGRREDLSGGGLVRSIGGWTEIRNAKDRLKGDQRILGGSDFVLKMLKEAEDNYERGFIIRNKGYTVDTVADIVAAIYGIKRDDVLSRGRHSPKVEARSLLCYIASHELGTSVTDLARLIGMTPSAISYAVSRGRIIAGEKDFQLERY
jgi:hypothetical protein